MKTKPDYGENLRREYVRQAWHVAFGSAFIVLLPVVGMPNLRIIAVATFALGSLLAFLLMRGIRIPHLHKIVCDVQRDHEKHLPGKGALALNLGILLALFLFGSPLVVLGGLIVLAYGDAASTIVGKRFGKHRLCKKSGRTVEGTVAGMLVSAVFLAIFFPLQTALAAATAGMLAEYIPPDDSFTIPVVGALALVLTGV